MVTQNEPESQEYDSISLILGQETRLRNQSQETQLNDEVLDTFRRSGWLVTTVEKRGGRIDRR
jgi:hypothetical protein